MKKALVVVDFQNDFIDGALGFDKAVSIKDNILALLNNFDGDIIFTYDTHFKDYLNTKEGQNLPIIHCIKDSPGWQIPIKLNPFIKKAKKIFHKESFGSLELANYLKDNNYDRVEFCGLVSHICVFHNIILAFNTNKNIELILHQNATASFDDELHLHAMALLRAFWVKIV